MKLALVTMEVFVKNDVLDTVFHHPVPEMLFHHPVSEMLFHRLVPEPRHYIKDSVFNDLATIEATEGRLPSRHNVLQSLPPKLHL